MSKPKLSGGLVHDLTPGLTKALTASPDVIKLWESITPIARNEFLCWIKNAKHEETRARRITRTIEELLDGQKRPCCWVGCIHRTDKAPSKWQQDVLIDKKPNQL